MEHKCFCCNKVYQHKFDEKLQKRFFNKYKFSNQDNNNLFHCCKEVFLLMNIWINGKNSMKHHCLKKKTFKVT